MREATRTGFEPVGRGDSHVATCGPLRDVAKWSMVKPYIAEIIERAASGASCWPLVMVGAAGSGKTCAAVAAVVKYGGHFYQFNEFCKTLVDADQDRLHHPTVGYRITTRMIWNDWRGSRLAVMDDVGTRMKVSDHQFDTLKMLLDSRETKPTIITTNLPIAGVAKVFDDRIASRLGGGTVIEFNGDRRITRQ